MPRAHCLFALASRYVVRYNGASAAGCLAGVLRCPQEFASAGEFLSRRLFEGVRDANHFATTLWVVFATTAFALWIHRLRDQEAPVKRWIFKHYVWTPPLCAIVIILLFFLCSAADRMTIIGTIIAIALGFFYFVQQQKLAETWLFKDLFTDFNRRYDALNDDLARIANSDPRPDAELIDLTDRQFIVDYFNLCAEEYLFFKQGYILPEAWKSWCTGMNFYFVREPFRGVWAQEDALGSYYGLSLDAIERGAGRTTDSAARNKAAESEPYS